MSGNDDNEFLTGPDSDHGLAVEESKPKLKKPPLYRVLLLNDDYSPMEFVVEVNNQPEATAVRAALTDVLGAAPEVKAFGKRVFGVYNKLVNSRDICTASDGWNNSLIFPDFRFLYEFTVEQSPDDAFVNKFLLQVEFPF